MTINYIKVVILKDGYDEAEAMNAEANESQDDNGGDSEDEDLADKIEDAAKNLVDKVEDKVEGAIEATVNKVEGAE